MTLERSHALKSLTLILFSIGSLAGQTGLSLAGANLTDATVRYVSVTGLDVNDGKSWVTSKATVAAAIASLPVTGNPSVHFGTVFIGPGRFVETATPIEFNAELHLACASSGGDGFGQGSVIQLADGRNTSLFSYTPAFALGNGYAHFLQVDSCTFDGNSAANLNAPPLVQVYNGGFQNTFRNVAFQNATNYALRLDNHAVNFACYSCTWGGARGNGGAVYINDVVGGNVISFVDSQIDNSGSDPIYIAQTNGDTGGSNVLTFINVKAEATMGVTNHKHIVTLMPRPGGGGHPMNINILGLTTVNTIGSGSYAIYEGNAPGYGANWEITGVNACGYKSAFYSEKTGQTSTGVQVKHLYASVPYQNNGAVYDYTPDLELSGGPAILTGIGSPQGVVAARAGSLYLRIEGGAASTLYVKESGTGATGWVAK